MRFENEPRGVTALLRDPDHRGKLFGGLGLLTGLGAGVAGYALFREPLRVRLDQLSVHLPGAAGHLPRRGLRILHLSDTHFRGNHWREQAKIDSIRRACAGLDYDLLIHTGDFLQYDSGLPNVLALLDTLPRPQLGGYAVFGNHDYTTYSHKDLLRRAWANYQEANGDGGNGTRPARRKARLAFAADLVRFGLYFANVPLDLKRVGRNDIQALETALAERGIRTLHNRYIRLSRATEDGDALDVYLAGVDDVTEGVPNLGLALEEIPRDAPTILLSHNPDILQEPGLDQVDLVLAGHTHGGQIVLPFLGAIHTQSEHLHRHEVAGFLRRGKTQVYITRGIGEGIPLRLGAAPQITLITVHGA
jgi:predicted MPP superfamily phosphohydrolase